MMNIQIFGTSKSFDSKKAERFFKERRIKYQYIDMARYGISLGELRSVISAVGIDEITDYDNPDAAIIRYLADKESKIIKLFENQDFIRVPIVRNGKQATVGNRPEIWSEWK